MKNLILTLAFVFATFTSFASTTNLEITNEIATTASIDGDFKEIAVAELPQAVRDAVAKDYAGATISKAYINAKKEYKIELTSGGESKTVFADSSGKWIAKDTIKKDTKKVE